MSNMPHVVSKWRLRHPLFDDANLWFYQYIGILYFSNSASTEEITNHDDTRRLWIRASWYNYEYNQRDATI